MRYEIYGNQDVTRWRLVDDTGRLIAVSAGAFLDKRDCVAAIKRIMDIGPAAIEDSTTIDEPRSSSAHRGGRCVASHGPARVHRMMCA